MSVTSCNKVQHRLSNLEVEPQEDLFPLNEYYESVDRPLDDIRWK